MGEFILSTGLTLGNPQVETERDVIVVGGGPAGLSAALYAARASAKPLVLIGEAVGGQAATTHDIENYPGFPNGVGGAALAQQMQTHAEKYGAEFLFETVKAVDLAVYPFEVHARSQAYTARAIVISTGSSPRRLGVPGEREFAGHGVSYCATCDGYFFKDKRVVVVGGGNSAIDESLFLTRLVREIEVIHRRDELRADPVLQERAFADPKIHFRWDTAVEEILGDDEVRAVRVRNTKTGESTTLETDGVFVYVGHIPNTGIFRGQLELDDDGYIVTDKLQRTSVPGVFAAGDVQDPIFRQIVTAAGTGSAAAIEAIRFLDEKRFEEKQRE
ncbi:MAG: thioredoxin-disulfide reductase [Anaerolineae bacterium]|nr:thioredoxin-disulfide reductase [Anaerolineae bacterium]